jgi:hypothetical protein
LKDFQSTSLNALTANTLQETANYAILPEKPARKTKAQHK